MSHRYDARLDELLADATLPPTLLRGLVDRLDRFLEPFVQTLCRSEQRTNARCYVAGLLAPLPHKNAESIAYFHDQDRQALQKFIGQAPWDDAPLLDELVSQVADRLGQPDGVLVFDPSAFAKCGTKSVGVKRQWCGRLGKVENCQVGIYLGYVSHLEHALVDFRLYLPREWATDKARRLEAGVPSEVRFHTRHELALQMLDARGAVLPHAWVAGDDEMGRSSWFRGQLRQRQEQYLLAVPSNTLVRPVVAAAPQAGQGRQRKGPFVRAEVWAAALPSEAWQTLEVRDGEHGPLVVQAVKEAVQAKDQGRRVGPQETLVVLRRQQSDGTWQQDYHLGWAQGEVALAEWARVAKAEYRIEECLKRAKSQAGLGDYQVRTWQGWHHHQTLSLLAGWFLVSQTEVEKKRCPALSVPQVAQMLGRLLQWRLGYDRPARIQRTAQRWLWRKEQARHYHWKRRNRLAPTRLNQRK
jgi:SRSO17 transposase